MLVDGDCAAAHGLRPLAKIVSWASAGVPPRDTGYGPVYAIPRALERAGLTIGDIDLAEINEAFASVPIAACKELGLDPAITNVNGSGCSLGHPVASTGARMIMTTMYELARRGGGIGLAAMCAGGGIPTAAIVKYSNSYLTMPSNSDYGEPRCVAASPRTRSAMATRSRPANRADQHEKGRGSWRQMTRL